MNRVILYLRGWARLRIYGAAQAAFLNRMTMQGIPFWEPEQCSETEMQITVLRKHCRRIMSLARKSQCEADILHTGGLRNTLARAARRPCFLLGAGITLAALLMLPRFVWWVQVSGNEKLDEELLLRELADCGVCFGAWGDDIDSAKVRDMLMNRLPELRWCAVNRSGGLVEVLIHEGSSPQEADKTAVCNLVAARSGIIDELQIRSGFRVCKPGQAVEAGDLLVSGIASWPMGSQMVAADGEVYALTSRPYAVMTPARTLKKRYCNEEMTCYTLIAGRKRINLSGNSGILHSRCDTITEYKQLTLPGGFSFPIALEIRHIRPYESEPVALDRVWAEPRLQAYTQQRVRQEMIAGTILDQRSSLTLEHGCWIIHTTYGCREMIARTVPVPIFDETPSVSP